MVWLGIGIPWFLHCFPNLLCLRSQIWKRGSFALFVRISAMQINGSFQIVTVVTSVAPTFLAALRFLFFIFAFRFLVLLYSLECAGDFAPAGATTGFALWIPTSL